MTPGQEGPLGANSPNLNYCCGPSGYCKPCKDQTRPVGGPINYPAWKANYESNIGRNTRLTDEQKFTYLKKNLAGKPKQQMERYK